jgi:hypothetical protein
MVCVLVFCLSNIFYKRFGRQSLLINKGLINLIPRMAVCWFILRASNILNVLNVVFFLMGNSPASEF